MTPLSARLNPTDTAHIFFLSSVYQKMSYHSSSSQPPNLHNERTLNLTLQPPPIRRSRTMCNSLAEEDHPGLYYAQSLPDARQLPANAQRASLMRFLDPRQSYFGAGDAPSLHPQQGGETHYLQRGGSVHLQRGGEVHYPTPQWTQWAQVRLRSEALIHPLIFFVVPRELNTALTVLCHRQCHRRRQDRSTIPAKILAKL